MAYLFESTEVRRAFRTDLVRIDSPFCFNDGHSWADDYHGVVQNKITGVHLYSYLDIIYSLLSFCRMPLVKSLALNISVSNAYSLLTYSRQHRYNRPRLTELASWR